MAVVFEHYDGNFGVATVAFSLRLASLRITTVVFGLAKVNHQNLIIFDGFMPNGLQIRNQHHFLHILACVKIGFDAILTFCHYVGRFGI